MHIVDRPIGSERKVDRPIIKPATVENIPFLWDMFFESVFTTEEERARLKNDIQRPEGFKKYLDGWGRAGDAAFVAEDENCNLVGAAWYRLFSKTERGEGILAHQDTPELAIAIKSDHREQGIGTSLMKALMQSARDSGYVQMMLSVDPRNVSAIRLYKNLGFNLLETDDVARGTSLIMQVDLF